MNSSDIETFIKSQKKAIQFKQSCAWRNGARFVLMNLEKQILKKQDGTD